MHLKRARQAGHLALHQCSGRGSCRGPEGHRTHVSSSADLHEAEGFPEACWLRPRLQTQSSPEENRPYLLLSLGIQGKEGGPGQGLRDRAPALYFLLLEPLFGEGTLLICKREHE